MQHGPLGNVSPAGSSEDSSRGGSPLDDAQLEILAKARKTKRKLRVAAYIALSNVLGLGACAIVALGFGFVSLSLSPIGLALLALAWNEQRGRALLLAADSRAPRRLALNQLALLLVVLVYCAASAYEAWTGPSLLDSVMQGYPELPGALGDGALGTDTSVAELSEWGRRAAVIVYGAVAIGSLVVQGLTAFYYLSLRPAVESFAATPAWARELA